MKLIFSIIVLSILNLICASHAQLEEVPVPTKIVGGTVAAQREFPYQASLRQFGRHICGGSVISSTKILTAAHCFSSTTASQFSIKAGMHDQTKVELSNQIRNVSSIVLHAQYSSSTYLNDIAVVTLDRPLKLDISIQTIALASAGSEVATGTNLVVSGWGDIFLNGPSSDILLKVELAVVAPSTCQAVYGPTSITNVVLCAGVMAGGKGPCQGDSGGPLATTNAASRVLIGIVSSGAGCAWSGYPGVFTKVSAYRPWILTNAGV